MKTDKQKFIAVGLGEVLWDILPRDKKLGGAPTNFAYHANSLGAQGWLISAVGKDALGDEILENVDRLNLNRDFVCVNRDHPTGTVTVELDANGDPDYIIHENVAWDFIPSNDELLKFASTVDVVCFGLLCQRSEVSRTTVREFLCETRDSCIRIFDVNIRQHYYSKVIIEELLGLSSVLKLNDEELPMVTNLLGLDGSAYHVLRELLTRFSLKLIVLTKGADGSMLLGNGFKSVIHAEPVDVADTVGAGDVFTASVAMGLLQNRSLREVHEHANRLATFVCSQAGATPELPKKLTEYFI